MQDTLPWQQRPLINTRVTLATWNRSELALLVLVLLATEEVTGINYLLILLFVLEKGCSNMIISIKQHQIAYFVQ